MMRDSATGVCGGGVPVCHLKKSEFYSIGLDLTGDLWMCYQFQQIHKPHKTTWEFCDLNIPSRRSSISFMILKGVFNSSYAKNSYRESRISRNFES